MIYEKTSTFLAKTTTSVCPTSQFLSEIIIKKNYAKSKIPNEKKQKYTLPTRSFIRIAYRKKLQKRHEKMIFF